MAALGGTLTPFAKDELLGALDILWRGGKLGLLGSFVQVVFVRRLTHRLLSFVDLRLSFLLLDLALPLRIDLLVDFRPELKNALIRLDVFELHVFRHASVGDGDVRMVAVMIPRGSELVGELFPALMKLRAVKYEDHAVFFLTEQLHLALAFLANHAVEAIRHLGLIDFLFGVSDRDVHV